MLIAPLAIFFCSFDFENKLLEGLCHHGGPALHESGVSPGRWGLWGRGLEPGGRGSQRGF